MCCLNPEERFDAHHCLNHPWLTGKMEFIFTPIQKFRIFNNLEKLMEVKKKKIAQKMNFFKKKLDFQSNNFLATFIQKIHKNLKNHEKFN